MVVTNKCLFPHDLDAAIKQVEAELGARFLNNQALLADAEATLPGLEAIFNEGTTLLDELLSKNGAGTSTFSNMDTTSSSDSTVTGIATSEDVANQYGLLPDNATKEQQEKFVSNADVILVDSIVYIDGKKSDNIKDAANIENLRRLYLALGKDLAKTQDALKNSTQTIVAMDKLNLVVVPYKDTVTPYPLAQIEVLLNQKQITNQDAAVTSDKRTVVLLKPFLSRDKSKAETMATNNIPSYQIISNAFHLNDVDNSSTAISRYTSFGFLGDELDAIINGTDLINSNILWFSNTVSHLHANAYSLINIIDFILQRIAGNVDPNNPIITTPEQIDETYQSLKRGVDALIVSHQEFISRSLFRVTSNLRSDIIDKLREKHTDEMIQNILERRTDIIGVYFDPPDDLFLNHISRTMSAAPPGSTYISNQAINGNTTPPVMDQQMQLSMYADLLDAKAALEKERNKFNLETAKRALAFYIVKDPIAKTVGAIGDILQGQPSAASPASILTPNFDIGSTMDIEKRKKNIYGSFSDLNDIYPQSVVGPLTDVINAAVALFDKAFKGIDRIIEQAQKTLFAMKKKLDSWLSKHMSLTGQGEFETSLLKCAVNWDIGVSTDILDRIFNFLMKALGQIISFIVKLKNWITDIITKILCLPVNLLNAFIGKLQQALPSACRLPKFDLGDKLNTSLKALMAVSTTRGVVLQSFDKDLAKLKMSVSAAPDRLGQFRDSALCESGATSNFMNASVLNVNAGLGV